MQPAVWRSLAKALTELFTHYGLLRDCCHRAGSEAVQICNLFNELHTSGQQPAQPSMQQQLPPHLLPAGSVFQAAAATPPPQQQQALSALPLQRQGLQGGALPPLLPGHGPLVHLPHTLQRSQQNTPPLPGAAPALSAGGAHSGLDAPLCISPHMLHGGMPAAAAGPGGASASAKDAAAAARAARQVWLPTYAPGRCSKAESKS